MASNMPQHLKMKVCQAIKEKNFKYIIDLCSVFAELDEKRKEEEGELVEC